MKRLVLVTVVIALLSLSCGPAGHATRLETMLASVPADAASGNVVWFSDMQRIKQLADVPADANLTDFINTDLVKKDVDRRLDLLAGYTLSDFSGGRTAERWSDTFGFNFFDTNQEIWLETLLKPNTTRPLFGSVLGSMISAVASLVSISRIRPSMKPCCSRAAWYSAFSDRSPWLRASAIARRASLRGGSAIAPPPPKRPAPPVHPLDRRPPRPAHRRGAGGGAGGCGGGAARAGGSGTAMISCTSRASRSSSKVIAAPPTRNARSAPSSLPTNCALGVVTNTPPPGPRGRGGPPPPRRWSPTPRPPPSSTRRWR